MQRLEPRWRPYRVGGFSRQCDVPEVLERRRPSGTLVGAIGDALVRGHGQVRLNLLLEVVQASQAPPFQPSEHAHVYSFVTIAGFMAIATVLLITNLERSR